METTTTKKNRSIKYGAAIKSCTIISLILTALEIWTAFSSFRMNNAGYEYMPFLFISLITMSLSLIAMFLFVLYIFLFYKRQKATVLLLILFGALALKDMGTAIMRFLNGDFTGFAVSLALFACLLPAWFSILKGTRQKLCISIAMIVYFLLSFSYDLLNIVFFILRLNSGFTTSCLETCLFCIALFLFALKNPIPPVVFSSKDSAQSLKLLQYQLDCGILTEEEYQTQSAKILDNLP